MLREPEKKLPTWGLKIGNSTLQILVWPRLKSHLKREMESTEKLWCAPNRRKILGPINVWEKILAQGQSHQQKDRLREQMQTSQKQDSWVLLTWERCGFRVPNQPTALPRQERKKLFSLVSTSVRILFLYLFEYIFDIGLKSPYILPGHH